MLFTPEHEDLRQTVRRFVEQEINPHVEEWEEAEIFPAHDLFKKMAKLGLLGISKPEAYGGMGLDYSYSVAFAEELGLANCGGVPMAIGVQTDMATPALARYGSDVLRREFLAPSVAGDLVASIGVSEPGAGSDVAGLKTTAVKDGGDYVINGSKMWITNGMQNDWICLLANTSEGKPHLNKSLIVVPMNTPGVVRTKKLKKLGMWSSDTAQRHGLHVGQPARASLARHATTFDRRRCGRDHARHRLQDDGHPAGEETELTMVEYLFETDEHRQLRSTVRCFAEKHVAPNARAWEEACEFPRELYRLAADARLLGLGYPEADGGAGGDITHGLVAVEEMILAGQSVGTAVGLGTHAIALPPIVALGTPSQKDRFVLPVLRGERISALGITEPNAGSDVANLSTRAVPDGDHYIVNGAKTFITSGCRADFVTTAVRTGSDGRGGVSLLVIERGTPGFSVSKKLDKTGWWASDTAELVFEDCRVPKENLIGEENAGFLAIMINFTSERLGLGAQCVAIAELAYREAVRYARQRHAFGKTLMGHQVVRHKLADMATRLAAARALVGECAMRHVRGESIPGLAAMTKNTATDMCSFVVDQAVQIHGGNGFMREYVVERLYRDARLYPIGGGTREIMNEIIAKTESY